MSEHAPAADPGIDHLSNHAVRGLIYLAQSTDPAPRTASAITRQLGINKGPWSTFRYLVDMQFLEKAALPDGQTNGLTASPCDQEYRMAAVSAMLDWSLTFSEQSLPHILGKGPGKPRPRRTLEILTHISESPNGGLSRAQIARLLDQRRDSIDGVLRTLIETGITELVTKNDLAHRLYRLTQDVRSRPNRQNELLFAMNTLAIEYVNSGQELVNGQGFVDALVGLYPHFEITDIRTALSKKMAKNITFADQDIFVGQTAIYRIKPELKRPVGDLATRFALLRDRDPKFLAAAVERGFQMMNTPEDIALLLNSSELTSHDAMVRRRLASLTLQRVPVDKKWVHKAACSDVSDKFQDSDDPFFPPGNKGSSRAQAEVAKKICSTCPVLASCLQWSLDSGQLYGIFGGMTFDERREYKSKPGIQQPLPADAPKTNAGISSYLDFAALS